jgi:tetratricopeptide (TPR) repeat protein
MATAIAGLMLALAASASAETIGALNENLLKIGPRVAQGVTDEAAASDAIARLDHDEAIFARFAQNPRFDRQQLLATYDRLEQMLGRMYTTYRKKKNDCIAIVNKGGQCDYSKPEELELRALYPLSWLRFEGALLYRDQPSMARRLLNQAIDGFTDSTLVLFAPELIRENLLGRAYAERELGKFDRSEYAKAVADFREIMKAGPGTRQYRAAEQGLATTYAATGQLDQAQKLMAQLAAGASGNQKEGFEMLRLRELFKAEGAATDSAKRARYHREAVEFMRAREENRDSWGVVIAAVAQYVSDPVAEFGHSTDPFEKYLLANVLYSEHHRIEAAKYYWQAAKSGDYPRAYKYAADIYYSYGQLDTVERLVGQIARDPRNPSAQWAAYMRFKIARIRWERAGKDDAQLQHQWITAARDYLKAYPHGRYAHETRFRVAEVLQRRGRYLEAVKQYDQVSGDPVYDYTARFNASECDYKALAALVNSSKEQHGSEPAADREALGKATVDRLQAAIKMEPGVERKAPAGHRQFLHATRGRAIYMLVTLLEHERGHGHGTDNRQIAALLSGYEDQYPSMSAHFDEIFEWRTQALNRLGQYAEIEREVEALRRRELGNPASADFIKEVGFDFWKSAELKRDHGDRDGYMADARLTALAYGYFDEMVQTGKIPARDLTGTLSILGQAYGAMGEADKAEAVFTQVVKADPASPDANAGLARIAQARKDYKDAVNLWTRVESSAAQSDNVWYEAQYNIAEIYGIQGNKVDACRKLAATRSEHPNLGTPEIKARWTALQRRLCLGHKED